MSAPTNLRWAICCQTCCNFHEAPIATGEGECRATNPPFEVLAGNVCDLHKPSDEHESEMDAETFQSKTGHRPVDDDLARVNCKVVGEPGHFSCGWCPTCDLPRFQCGHLVKPLV